MRLLISFTASKPDELDDIATWRIGGTDPTGGITEITGDVNGDGKVDVADVNIIIDMILQLTPTTSYNNRGDVNGDGKVDVADVNIVIDTILGL